MGNKYSDEYKERKSRDDILQRCAVCGRMWTRTGMEPHHPRGRQGRKLLEYVWVDKHCHRWIHNNPEQAKQMGLLFPQIYEEED